MLWISGILVPSSELYLEITLAIIMTCRPRRTEKFSGTELAVSGSRFWAREACSISTRTKLRFPSSCSERAS